jgi:perosamine synthetase
MGVAQLEQLDDYIAAKRRIAGNYTDAFDGTPGITPMREADWAFSIFWMYTVLFSGQRHVGNSRKLLDDLSASQIQTRPLWQPLHLSPAHIQCQAYKCTVAEHLNRDALSLPCSIGLTKAEQERVIKALQKQAA